MKKSKAYFLAPILALVIFIAYYWNFKSGYDAREAAKAAQFKEARNEKLLQEEQQREKAIADAIAQQAQRKKEREAREARDQLRAEQRQAALQAEGKAASDAFREKDQFQRLTKEVQMTKDEIAKIDQDKDKNLAEETFLKQYIEQTRANVTSLSAVITQIDAADAARATQAAEAAALAAAKK